MNTILSANGYGIEKSGNKDLVERLRDELTMKPNVSFAITSNIEKIFPIYAENDKYLYVPRYLGLQRYGAPAKCMISEGVSCDRMVFEGKLRDQQLEPVKNFITAAGDPLKRGGIISVPCGFGKTIMSVYIACHFKRKTMFVSHKDFLNQQFIETVQKFVPKAKIGTIKQSKVDVAGKDFVIASLQSLAMREYDMEIFKEFGLVIIDEVHHLGAEVFCRAFRKLNVSMILGLSATLNRKDGMRKVFESYIGKSVYRLVGEEKCEVLVDVHKYFDPDINYSGNKMLWNGKPNCAAMINNICAYEPRNRFVIQLLKEVLEKDPDRRVLILSERRQQLKTIEEMARESCVSSDIGYYVGGMQQKDLDISAERQVLLATYQMAAEGMNVPKLNTVIFASPISDIQQSIGRILREKPDERIYTPLCIDVWDEFSVFVNKGYARQKYYKKNGYTVKQFLDHEEVVVKKDVKYEFVEDE